MTRYTFRAAVSVAANAPAVAAARGVGRGGSGCKRGRYRCDVREKATSRPARTGKGGHMELIILVALIALVWALGSEALGGNR